MSYYIINKYFTLNLSEINLFSCLKCFTSGLPANNANCILYLLPKCLQLLVVCSNSLKFILLHFHGNRKHIL